MMNYLIVPAHTPFIPALFIKFSAPGRVQLHDELPYCASSHTPFIPALFIKFSAPGRVQLHDELPYCVSSHPLHSCIIYKVLCSG